MSVLALRLAAAPPLLALLLAAAAPAEFPRMSGFSAYLLNSRTGRLSGDVMVSTDQLGNVPAGPLSAVSTLVVVRVAFGPEATVPQGARVRLVATVASGHGRSGRVLLDRVSQLGPVADDGSTHVGFWLDDTKCAPVTLRASLLPGQTSKVASATAQAILPFACNE
jgi:hypothetical protein